MQRQFVKSLKFSFEARDAQNWIMTLPPRDPLYIGVYLLKLSKFKSHFLKNLLVMTRQWQNDCSTGNFPQSNDVVCSSRSQKLTIWTQFDTNKIRFSRSSKVNDIKATLDHRSGPSMFSFHESRRKLNSLRFSVLHTLNVRAFQSLWWPQNWVLWKS